MRSACVAWAELPTQARALFGGDFFSTLSWYETVQRTALPEGNSAEFVLIEDAGHVAVVFPMRRAGGRLASLTTPYTCLWQPLTAAGLGPDGLRAIGAAFARFCLARPVRLDALDLMSATWAPVLAGLRQGGVRALVFDHFGNWVFPDAGIGWAAYLATRPGQLREALRRRTKKLMAAGAVFAVVDGAAGLAEGIAAYEAMHARSWKAAEPFPDFNAALMRACAADGSLRLGVLSLDGKVLAAQFWVVFNRCGMVLKLAHDRDADKWSPGTVLTGLMIRRLMDQDSVESLDFGRGDDSYKQLWMSARRQRSGVVLANPWRPAGALEIARQAAGDLRKRLMTRS